MYETTKTLDILRDDTYFKDEKGNLQWPDVFEHVFNEGKIHSLRTPIITRSFQVINKVYIFVRIFSSPCEHWVVLFGTLDLFRRKVFVFRNRSSSRYLQHCLVDKELLSMRKFVVFQPPDENIQLKESSTVKQQNMVREFSSGLSRNKSLRIFFRFSTLQLCSIWKFFPIVEVEKKVHYCTPVIDVQLILVNVCWLDG